MVIKKRNRAADSRPRFDDEESQERKISSSAQSPIRKVKKKKEAVAEKEPLPWEDDTRKFATPTEEVKKKKRDPDALRKKKRLGSGTIESKVKVKAKAASDDDLGTLPVKKKKIKLSSIDSPKVDSKPTEDEKKEGTPAKKPKSAKSLKAKAAKAKDAIAQDMAVIEDEAEEFADNTWVKTYHSMFRKLRTIMRAAELRTQTSEKAADIYALMALYNQMREVIADLRSMIDLSQNTQRITDLIIEPLVRDMSHSYADSIYRIYKVLRLHIEGQKYGEVKADLDRIFGDYARYMESAKNKSIAKLTDMLED